MVWTWKDPELSISPLWGISVSENLFNLCRTGWWRNEEKKTLAPVFFSVPIWRSLSRFPCPKKIKTHLIEPAICNRLPSICACQMTYHPHKSELLPLVGVLPLISTSFFPLCVYSSPGLIPFSEGDLTSVRKKKNPQHPWHQFKKICSWLCLKQPGLSPAVDLCLRKGSDLCKLPLSSALWAFLHPCSAGW